MALIVIVEIAIHYFDSFKKFRKRFGPVRQLKITIDLDTRKICQDPRAKPSNIGKGDPAQLLDQLKRILARNPGTVHQGHCDLMLIEEPKDALAKFLTDPRSVTKFNREANVSGQQW